MDYTVYHSKKCSGHLTIDVTEHFAIRSPSLSFSPSGIAVGILEIVGVNVSSKAVKFSCSRCTQVLSVEDVLEKSIATCSFCQKNFPVGELYTSFEAMIICKECKEVVTGEKKGEASDRIKKLSQMVFLPNRTGTERKFVLLSDIFHKPIKY